MVRCIRITASAFCVVACMAIVVLWVRSYKYWDEVRCRLPNGEALQLYSTQGRLAWRDWSLPADEDYPRCYRCYFAMNEQKRNLGWTPYETAGFFYSRTLQNTTLLVPQSRMIVLPLWFFVAINIVFAAGLGIRRPWRFSLRTMIIATTLIAATLGTSLALSR